MRRYAQVVPRFLLALIFVCAGPWLGACGRGQAGVKGTQTTSITATPVLATVTPAREALETFFALLHDGRYADAAAYYGGDYQVLCDWNPTVASDDHAKLLENGCTINGLQCLALKEVVVEEELSPTTYRFTAEFVARDGGTFVRAPSTERFVYTVVKVDDRFLVQELPVYVP